MGLDLTVTAIPCGHVPFGMAVMPFVARFLDVETPREGGVQGRSRLYEIGPGWADIAAPATIDATL